VLSRTALIAIMPWHYALVAIEHMAVRTDPGMEALTQIKLMARHCSRFGRHHG
jgi:hypothetical protein